LDGLDVAAALVSDFGRVLALVLGSAVRFGRGRFPADRGLAASIRSASSTAASAGWIRGRGLILILGCSYLVVGLGGGIRDPSRSSGYRGLTCRRSRRG